MGHWFWRTLNRILASPPKAQQQAVEVYQEPRQRRRRVKILHPDTAPGDETDQEFEAVTEPSPDLEEKVREKILAERPAQEKEPVRVVVFRAPEREPRYFEPRYLPRTRRVPIITPRAPRITPRMPRLR